MFEKTLASIYFSGDSVFVCELDSSRKKIKKAVSVATPEGILSSKKVLDKKKLAQIIKELWSKKSIKSKDVGIVIPEFSTFTKLLSLPKLSTSEMGEAVNYQAQEYLPMGIEKMVLDWKILEKGENKTDILMVAVPKDTLMDYVDACVEAGLFPIAVEIPSIALGNIIDSPGGYMAIFAEGNQTVIISGEENKIYGTSVVDGSSSNVLSSTASRIVKHFSNVSFKNIFVGGEKITDQVVGDLKKTFKMNVLVLNPKIEGDPQVVQKYLIALSLLKKNIAEPSDPNTLNLLPGNLVGKYQTQKVKNQVWSLTLTVTVFVWISLLVVLGSFMVMNQQISFYKAKNAKFAQTASQIKQSEAEANTINTNVRNVIAVKNASTPAEDVLNRIFMAKPQAVNINSYDLDLDKGTIGLRGVSLDRQSLITFKDNLEKDEYIKSVNIPISSFEAESNLTFSISFTYSKVQQPVVDNIK